MSQPDVFARPQGLDTRKAWWGVSYLTAMCAQAGYRFDPTPGQGDVFSFDGQVFFRSTLSVFVQVKCTSRRLVRSRSYRIEPAWRVNWEDLDLPGYFVVVSVPPDTQDWVEHLPSTRSTHLLSAGYWTRIDPLPATQTSIQVKATQRLTVNTFDSWAADLKAATHGYGRGETA